MQQVPRGIVNIQFHRVPRTTYSCSPYFQTKWQRDAIRYIVTASAQWSGSLVPRWFPPVSPTGVAEEGPLAGGPCPPPEPLGQEASWSLANEARVSWVRPHIPTEVPITPQMYTIGTLSPLDPRFDPTANGVPLSVVRPPLHYAKGLHWGTAAWWVTI